jgi:hypothetical protein
MFHLLRLVVPGGCSRYFCGPYVPPLLTPSFCTLHSQLHQQHVGRLQLARQLRTATFHLEHTSSVFLGPHLEHVGGLQLARQSPTATFFLEHTSYVFLSRTWNMLVASSWLKPARASSPRLNSAPAHSLLLAMRRATSLFCSPSSFTVSLSSSGKHCRQHSGQQQIC